ncbi:MAG: DUF4282 domain-containing protein [Rhizomicrobium sp.]
MQFSDLFSFEKFLAPVLIKVAYWIGLVLIVLATLAGMLGMSLMSRYTGTYGGHPGIGGVLLALVLGVLWTILWRIVCEAWIVIFSINARLGILAHNSQPRP